MSHVLTLDSRSRKAIVPAPGPRPPAPGPGDLGLQERQVRNLVALGLTAKQCLDSMNTMQPVQGRERARMRCDAMGGFAGVFIYRCSPELETK